MSRIAGEPRQGRLKSLAALLQLTAALAAAGLLLDSNLHGPLAAWVLVSLVLAGLLYHRLPPALVEVQLPAPPAPAAEPEAPLLPPAPVAEQQADPGLPLRAPLAQLLDGILRTEQDMQYATELARAGGEKVQFSAASIQACEAAIRELAGYMESIDQVFDGLSQQSLRIGALVGSIQDIAKQTNLLALTRPSRPRGPASTAAVSPWWPTRCVIWPSAPTSPASRFARSPAACGSRRRRRGPGSSISVSPPAPAWRKPPRPWAPWARCVRARRRGWR